jgi:hypothetical protein
MAVDIHPDAAGAEEAGARVLPQFSLTLQLFLPFNAFGDAALIDETTHNDTPKYENW